MRPKRSAAASTTRSTSARSVRSPGRASASEPARSISPTHALSASSFRAVTTTFAPRSPAPRAIARPRPLEAPVTTITWSESGFFINRKSPVWRPPNALPCLYERLDQPDTHRHPALDRVAPLRREAAARDRALAGLGDAGVQGLALRPHPVGAGAASASRRAEADADRARRALAPDGLAAAPSWPRRGGHARRAPRGAS